MKQVLTLIGFVIATNSFAAKVVEFDHSQEVKCHNEIKSMGCASQSDEEIMECVEKKKDRLSKECKDIHSTKVKNSQTTSK